MSGGRTAVECVAYRCHAIRSTCLKFYCTLRLRQWNFVRFRSLCALTFLVIRQCSVREGSNMKSEYIWTKTLLLHKILCISSSLRLRCDDWRLYVPVQHCNILPVSFICSERFSAYQNTAVLFGKQQDVTTSSTVTSEHGNSNTLQHPERKKPVPLPRSKIPVTKSQTQTTQTQSKSQTSNSAQQPKKQPSAAASLHARFFSKRAKTDLGFDGLAAYKANKRPPGGTKYPAPKVPTFNRPVPQQRQQQQSQMPQLSQSQSQPRFNLPQKQQKEATNKATKKPEAKIKPEIKEKPLFSTFKQREQNDSFRFVEGYHHFLPLYFV